MKSKAGILTVVVMFVFAALGFLLGLITGVNPYIDLVVSCIFAVPLLYFSFKFIYFYIITSNIDKDESDER